MDQTWLAFPDAQARAAGSLQSLSSTKHYDALSGKEKGGGEDLVIVLQGCLRRRDNHGAQQTAAEQMLPLEACREPGSCGSLGQSLGNGMMLRCPLVVFLQTARL